MNHNWQSVENSRRKKRATEKMIELWTVWHELDKKVTRNIMGRTSMTANAYLHEFLWMNLNSHNEWMNSNSHWWIHIMNEWIQTRIMNECIQTRIMNEWMHANSHNEWINECIQTHNEWVNLTEEHKITCDTRQLVIHWTVSSVYLKIQDLSIHVAKSDRFPSC